MLPVGVRNAGMATPIWAFTPLRRHRLSARVYAHVRRPDGTASNPCNASRDIQSPRVTDRRGEHQTHAEQREQSAKNECWTETKCVRDEAAHDGSDRKRSHCSDTCDGDRKSTRLNSSHLGISYAV